MLVTIARLFPTQLINIFLNRKSVKVKIPISNIKIAKTDYKSEQCFKYFDKYKGCVQKRIKIEGAYIWMKIKNI